ncbi:restriction endonuclease subunit S [Flavobacterium luteum]|uniref:Restriction endonuclease subunit S n=1 Tax=Flavobacterium luteum TaxID=2026654 RepID=A0A7J5AB73_9FLAO|nr:restriction endonuclease subunit S [Flavobacterium luteum]KAB1154790.1 restriction endonuclease subunit S [Flavobacterium luteum]
MELVQEKFIETEIGLIPSDWEVMKLGNMTKLMTNGFVGIAKTHYTENRDGVLYIQGYNVEENSFKFKGIKKVTLEFHLNNSKSCLKKDDLLTVQTGDVGLTTIVPKYLEGSNCHALIITRFKKNRYNALFYCYYLNSKTGRGRLKEIETGTTMKHINVGELIHFEVPVPTTVEQTLIASALSNTDSWITNLENLLTKKRQIKQGALQELLKPKKGWEVKKLGDVGECIIGLTYSPDNVTSEGKLVLRSSNVKDNKLVFSDTVFVNVEVSEKLITRKGDILICVRNGSRNLIGKCAYIDGRGVGETFGAFMSVFRSNYNAYIFQVFQSNIIKKQIEEHLGATINQITNKSLNSFQIPFPTIKEQEYIVDILSDMDAEIEQLETKLEKAKKVKQGMMQELLTGKTRLV